MWKVRGLNIRSNIKSIHIESYHIIYTQHGVQASSGVPGQHMDSNIKSVHKESRHKYLINQSTIIKWSAR